ncbi:MAG: SEC-C domain-containing protein [Burkholderiales bacterium]|nr:SEC-C domain-containing protein [Burkholderiales bacterium]
MQPLGGKKPCHCGSGKKYKRCHGPSDRAFALAGLQQIQAREALRQRQQGMGRGIISEQVNGLRMVAVGDSYQLGRWGTFHSFLTESYLPTVFGFSWMTAEAARPPEERHELLLWAVEVRAQDKRDRRSPGVVTVSTMTGAVACYLSLAHDLYCIKHNADLQAKLIARMKVKDQFHSARYEARIAAAFVRAGFAVEFEDEEDGSSKHHEFTATSKTGRQFSVECKRRAGSQSVRIGQLFNDAQRKPAKHDRVIFIELNDLDADLVEDPDRPVFDSDGRLVGKLPACFSKARKAVMRLAAEPLPPSGEQRPPCHVFLTNAPWERCLDQTVLPFAFTLLICGLESANGEIVDFARSMQAHREVPATFDGEDPELAFKDSLRPAESPTTAEDDS